MFQCSKLGYITALLNDLATQFFHDVCAIIYIIYGMQWMIEIYLKWDIKGNLLSWVVINKKKLQLSLIILNTQLKAGPLIMNFDLKGHLSTFHDLVSFLYSASDYWIYDLVKVWMYWTLETKNCQKIFIDKTNFHLR